MIQFFNERENQNFLLFLGVLLLCCCCDYVFTLDGMLLYSGDILHLLMIFRYMQSGFGGSLESQFVRFNSPLLLLKSILSSLALLCQIDFGDENLFWAKARQSSFYGGLI